MQALIEQALKEACALTLAHGSELLALVNGTAPSADAQKRRLAEECMSLQAYFSMNKEPVPDNAETRQRLNEFRQVLDELKGLYS